MRGGKIDCIPVFLPFPSKTERLSHGFIISHKRKLNRDAGGNQTVSEYKPASLRLESLTFHLPPSVVRAFKILLLKRQKIKSGDTWT